MGCGFTTAKYYKEGTSHAIRTRMEKNANAAPHEFHDKFILDEKIVQGVFGQINLAHQVAEGEGRTSGKSNRNSGSNPLAATTTSRRQGSVNSVRLEIIEYSAVKIVDMRMKGTKLMKVMQNEINFWKNLKHEDHVMELKQTFQSVDLCYMVMESCFGSLLFYMERLSDLNERTLGDCFSQMLMGIKFLHSNRVIHRAVKPDSFLVGFQDGRKSIKLCDFTFAVMLPFGQDQLREECGSALFMSPEMVSNRGYDMKTDVWSFGIIVYALLFGRFPCEHHAMDSNDVKDAIATAGAIKFETEVPLSSNCVSFSMALLKRNPSNRPTSSEALTTPYMSNTIAEEHLVEDDLPDLRPMLDKVRKFRSFEYHEPQEKSVIDDVLNRHQLTRHGMPLPKMKDTSIVLGGVSGAKALESVKHLEKRNSATDEGIGTLRKAASAGNRRRGKSNADEQAELYWV
jgi:serine/threonine protein kinase